MHQHICAGIQYPVFDTEGKLEGHAHSDLCGYGDADWRELLHGALDEYLNKINTVEFQDIDPHDGSYFFVGNPWSEDNNE